MRDRPRPQPVASFHAWRHRSRYNASDLASQQLPNTAPIPPGLPRIRLGNAIPLRSVRMTPVINRPIIPVSSPVMMMNPNSPPMTLAIPSREAIQYAVTEGTRGQNLQLTSFYMSIVDGESRLILCPSSVRIVNPPSSDSEVPLTNSSRNSITNETMDIPMEELEKTDEDLSQSSSTTPLLWSVNKLKEMGARPCRLVLEMLSLRDLVALDKAVMNSADRTFLHSEYAVLPLSVTPTLMNSNPVEYLNSLVSHFPAVASLDLSHLPHESIPNADLWDTLRRYSLLQSLVLNSADDAFFTEVISRLPSLVSLEIHHGAMLTDEAFHKCVSVASTSSVNGSVTTSEEMVIEESGLPFVRNLKSLQLHHSPITDNGISYLSKFKSLESLQLIDCHNFTDTAIRDISSLPCLRELVLRSYEHLTDAGIEHLVHLADTLEKLELSEYSTGLTDAIMTSISKLHNLKSLNLFYCGLLTDDGLVKIGLLPKLRSLDVSFTRLTDIGLASLSQDLRSLVELNVSGCISVTDAGLWSLNKMPALTKIDISFCESITDDGLSALAVRVPHLTSLKLGFCSGVTSVGLKWLGRLQELNELDVSGLEHLNDDSVRSIADLNALQYLDISQCYSLTDLGIQRLMSLKTLEHLSACFCNFTGSGFGAADASCRISELHLRGCSALTDAGLSSISRLNSLHTLELSDCESVSFAGIQPLVRLTNLEMLSVSGCVGIIATPERVRSLFPSTEVQFLPV